MTDILNRIKLVFDETNLKKEEFAVMIGQSFSRVNNVMAGSQKPPSDFLSDLCHYRGVNGHWLLTGEGDMFSGPHVNYDEGEPSPRLKVAEPKPNFDKDSRATRLCGFIKHWLSNHNTDEQAWFEIDFKNKYKDYAQWVERDGSNGQNKQVGG